MNFDLGLMAEAMKATVTFAVLSSFGIGIVLGSIVVCRNFIREKRRGGRPLP
jgi:hypothetical protein